jgi:hypothetical protein
MNQAVEPKVQTNEEKMEIHIYFNKSINIITNNKLYLVTPSHHITVSDKVPRKHKE